MSPESGGSQGKAASVGSSSSRTPKSPWMPFPMLFSAISSEVAPKDMELVNVHYDLFRVRLKIFLFLLSRFVFDIFTVFILCYNNFISGKEDNTC